jgi:hypothetical protein
MNENLQKVDHSALRVNQSFIILIGLLAFVLNQPVLALLVAGIMALGWLFKVPGFGFIYRYALKPSGLVKPDVLMDNPEPHRFSQGLGALFLFGGSAALFAGSAALGWGLVWLVIFLAGLNLFAGFCVGCAVYYWLARFKIPGFRKSPPAGTFPGMRPNTKAAGGGAA